MSSPARPEAEAVLGVARALRPFSSPTAGGTMLELMQDCIDSRLGLSTSAVEPATVESARGVHNVAHRGLAELADPHMRKDEIDALTLRIHQQQELLLKDLEGLPKISALDRSTSGRDPSASGRDHSTSRHDQQPTGEEYRHASPSRVMELMV